MTMAPPEESTWTEKRVRQHALYPRQKEALQLYAQGYRYTDIADKMQVAVGTARSYIGACRTALDAESPTDAVRIAIERGEIEPVGNA